MTTTDLTTRWPAVLAVAAATFSVVTAEMLPVGLLTPMAAELGVSEGLAGLTMTVPGLLAALAAPLVPVAAGRMDRRWLLAGLVALLAAANLVSAVSPNLALMVGARVLVGVAIGGVWAIAAGLGGRLVPQESAGTATSVIFSGIAIASVLGVPAGTFVGEFGGWRTSFAVLGVLALLVAGLLAVLLPPLPAEEAMRLGTVRDVARGRSIRSGLLVVLFLVSGHFAAYTYVRPILESIVDVKLIGALLLAYGLAGVVGNFLGGASAAKQPRHTLMVIAAVLPAAVVALVLPIGPLGAVLVLLVWGLAYGGVSVSTQTWLLTAAPQSREAASALFVSAFNIAISLGAFLGGRAVDAISPTAAFSLGALLALAALATITAARTRTAS
ncbi:MFS transporter [Saccharopolyspora sp. WRP15-2]|uniref:MFS transporter n=1 Tax=Saccharopolyspora oryzae TaxID=2997343 RepID=A0ABT4USX0_9PSEU|nr:MFS transporter [Saccharopolyspora oryzae]MDA3624810.1 MFS transporter [Saccharopolyspora oryzae]